MAKENKGEGEATQAVAKKKRTSQGAKPLYLVHAGSVNAEGKIDNLLITRDTRKVMKHLSDNPGAKIEEHLVS